MSTIEFVVRGDAGVVQRGAIGGNAGQNVVVGADQDISLNLQRSHILSYTRQGQALEITLVDGQVITIEGFFGADGTTENQLFISSGGQLAEVQLLSADGNLFLAQYVDADSFGKWSPDDALYFTEAADLPLVGVEPASEAGMLGVPLMGGLGGLGGLGAAAAAGGAMLLAGGGNGDGEEAGEVETGGGGGSVNPDGPDKPEEEPEPDPDPEVDPDPQPEPDPDPEVDPDPVDPPVVDITGGVQSAGHVVNAEDHADGVEISGTGTPNATGVITVGDASQNVVVDADGNWTATFSNTEVTGGEYTQDVSITLTNEGGSVTTTDTLVVDTFTEVTFDASTVEGEGTVNFVEESDGVVLTGTTQAGSSVVVTIDGNSYAAEVIGTEWSAGIPAGDFAQGEYDVDITVTATDQYGNTASTTDTLHIDTITDVTVNTSAAGNDGTVNEVEHADGVTVNGLAEAGASVVVTLGTVSQTVQANSSGQWTATYASSDVPTGEYDLPVTAVATDAAGNTATASGTVTIDTELDVTVDTANVETDGIVNMVERSDGVTLVGTADAGSSVQVVFEGGVRNVQADGDGNWSADFAASEIRGGNVEVGAPVMVTATDAAGNIATTNGTVQLDTYVNRLESTGMVEGDDIVNNAEAQDGITLTGVVEHGSSVMVEFEGVTRAATVNSDGTWTVDFAASEIPGGTYDALVNITATDAAGNTASITDTFHVDTDAPDLPNAEGYFRGEEGTEIIATATTDDTSAPGQASDVTFHEFVEGGATATAVDATTLMSFNGRTSYGFDDGHAVPDGSHVVITAEDDAGNTNSTLMVLDSDSGNAVDVTAGALDQFNIGAIDLEFADAAELTLSVADLQAMSGNDNTLIIHGDGEDSVTLEGTATAAGSTVIDGKAYDIYSIGDDGSQLIIGSDVDFNQSIV